MKRILLLTLLLLPLMVYSTPKSEGDCRKVAANFLASKTGFCDINSLQLVNGRVLSKSGTDNDEYYIYDTPSKGFVIVAGDDSVTPVIGYSLNGKFVDDESMTNFKWWMDIWSRTIASNRAKGLKATAATGSEWDKYIKGGTVKEEGGDEKILETALWNQGSPYNICCPKIGGTHTLTGCVATAMGILMKYFEWPVAGIGITPAYTYGGYSVPAVELGEEYDWKNMPNSLSGSSSDAEKHAVATLLYHAGVSVKAMYGVDGTGAYSEDIRNAMVTYMDYDKSAVFKYAELYSNEEWIGMIKDNVQNIGPVLYGGTSGEGGHQFIVSGYDSSNRFYINWGWGGANNGYYSYPGIGEFTENNDVLLNLKKNCGGKSPASIDLYHVETSAKPGISLSCTSIEVGVPFTASVESMWNSGNEPFAGDVGIARVSSQNKVIEVLSVLSIVDLARAEGMEAFLQGYVIYPVVFKNCVISSEPTIGEKLMCVFRDIGDSEWSICHYDMSDKDFVGEIPLADSFSIEQTTRLVYSAEGTLLVTSKNGVLLKLLGPGGEDMSAVHSSDENGWTIDVTKLKPAKYKLQLSKDKEFKEITVSMGLKK